MIWKMYTAMLLKMQGVGGHLPAHVQMRHYPFQPFQRKGDCHVLLICKRGNRASSEVLVLGGWRGHQRIGSTATALRVVWQSPLLLWLLKKNIEMRVDIVQSYGISCESSVAGLHVVAAVEGFLRLFVTHIAINPDPHITPQIPTHIALFFPFFFPFFFGWAGYFVSFVRIKVVNRITYGFSSWRGCSIGKLAAWLLPDLLIQRRDLIKDSRVNLVLQLSIPF